MPDLTPITAREANQRFSEVLGAVEATGEGFLVTKRGVPVARILPIEGQRDRLTPEQAAALDRLLAASRPLGIGRYDREEAYEERLAPESRRHGR
jgi:prevent-host-death family protein